jgi:hypothetical protein
MATRDPFQKTFTTLEELLANPRGRVRANPSKAYETIVNAVKASGGWIQKQGHDEPDYVYGVLSGPYTGTYIMGHKKFQYRPRFEFGIPITVNTLGIASRMNKSILAKIGPLQMAVDAALAAAGVTYATDVPNMDDAWWARIQENLAETAGSRGEEREWVLIHEADEGGHEERWVEMIDVPPDRKARDARQFERATRAPERERPKYEEVNRIKASIKSPRRKIAETLYILCEASGTPQEKVIESLREQPKRIMTLSDRNFHVPPRLTDRKRFGAELFRTWSFKAAIKRILPNVEGDVSSLLTPTGYLSIARLRPVLSGLPSWKQIALRETHDDNDDFYSGFKPKSQEDRIQDFLGQVTLRYDSLKPLGIRDGEFRELLQKRGLDWLAHFHDALQAATYSQEVLSETNEGRQLLRAVNERDWPRVHREHNRAVAARAVEWDRLRARQADPTAGDPDKAEQFKSRARQFTLIEGVRPLTTEEEYKCEGTEMQHCVYSMGYFYKKDAFEFAFKAPDGTRATLELGKNGVVRQFFGPGDTTPSKATKMMLEEFKAVNADNIAAMKQGKFPVQQNPLRRHRP